MTIIEYLLLKNTLNLQLSIALQKGDMIFSHGNPYSICGEDCNITVINIEVENINNSLSTLDLCYNKELSLEKTVEKIGFGLLPQK